MNINLSKPIKVILIAGFVLLPFTHLRILPDLGTTRPISSILFVLAFGIIGLEYLVNGLASLRSTIINLLNLNGGKILRYWLALIGLGIISALITPFYGNFFQALNRLLGYLIIFATLYCALYALQHYGIAPIAKWISIGYLPALIYGCIESLVAFHIPWAISAVEMIRHYLIVQVEWTGQLSLFATEPSFISFQVVLLIAILPFLQQHWLRWTNLAVILLAFVFSLSGHVIIEILVYLTVLGFFSLQRAVRLGLAGGSVGLAGIAAISYIFIAPVQVATQSFVSRLMQIDRLKNMSLSAAIRASYIKNLIFTMIETHGLGLGIGQYGQFWKDIYMRHINYQPLGREVANALNSSAYMRPWSVILGIGVDLGVVGLLLMLGFLYEVWNYVHQMRSFCAHGMAIWVASIIALAGAYPIVTPHIWIALALLAGVGSQQIAQSSKAVEQAPETAA